MGLLFTFLTLGLSVDSYNLKLIFEFFSSLTFGLPTNYKLYSSFSCAANPVDKHFIWLDLAQELSLV